jgi:hypothetical protein
MLNKLFNRYNLATSILGSTYNVDIYRPDYTAADQTGTLVASNVSLRADTRSQQWAEPSLQGGMYFDMFLNRKLVQIGDYVVPTGVSPTIAFTTSEIITICSIDGLKPCVGLLTDAIGRITNEVSDTVYSNVRFQWASPGTPKPPAINNLDVMPYDRRKVIMFRRQGQGLPTPLINGMRLVQTIDGLDYWWNIVDVLSVGNFTMLQTEMDQS